MVRNNPNLSVEEEEKQSFHSNPENTSADTNINQSKHTEGEPEKIKGSNSNNDGSNEPYLADGDTSLRKKDPDNPADWRENDTPNPSRETSGWQKSNDFDDTIREPEGTFTTGERGNVINSATWDPESHTKEEDVGHVDVNDYDQTISPENRTKEQQVKFEDSL